MGLSFIGLIGVSMVAGFVGAMSGMGGGVVLIPALTYLGMDIRHAIALSMVSVIATSSGSASAYVRDGLTNLKVGMFLEAFTMLGGWTGAWLALYVDRQWLFLIFGLVLLGSWLILFLRRSEEWQPVSHPDRFSQWMELQGEYVEGATGETVRYAATRSWLGAPLMYGAGILAGMLGIGAGALKVLIHDLVMALPPKVSTTTSNLIIGVTALSGASVYLSQGLIDPNLAAPIVIGIVAGAFLGTRLLVRMRNKTVHHFFLVVLAVLGAEMIFRGWKGG